MNNLIEFIGNNTLLSLAVVASFLAAVFNELRIKAQSLGSLTPAEAVRLINGGAVVIDIRDADSFEAAHLIDSENLSPAEIANHKRLKANKSVLLVCDNGAKSARALAELRKAGFTNSFIIKGGFSAWQQEKLPVETA